FRAQFSGIFRELFPAFLPKLFYKKVFPCQSGLDDGGLFCKIKISAVHFATRITISKKLKKLLNSKPTLSVG
ncbi:MAG: hypothetical protein ACOYBP_09250, partial [Microbacteriaceae bacterium]